MKKSHTEEQTKSVEVIDDIICNNCGNSLREDCGFEGLVEVVITGGYGSRIGDMTQTTFSICESCLEKMYKSFKIPPLQVDLMGGIDEEELKEMYKTNKEDKTA